MISYLGEQDANIHDPTRALGTRYLFVSSETDICHSLLIMITL